MKIDREPLDARHLADRLDATARHLVDLSRTVAALSAAMTRAADAITQYAPHLQRIQQEHHDRLALAAMRAALSRRRR